jgi:hypothetical protein
MQASARSRDACRDRRRPTRLSSPAYRPSARSGETSAAAARSSQRTPSHPGGSCTDGNPLAHHRQAVRTWPRAAAANRPRPRCAQAEAWRRPLSLHRFSHPISTEHGGHAAAGHVELAHMPARGMTTLRACLQMRRRMTAHPPAAFLLQSARNKKGPAAHRADRPKKPLALATGTRANDDQDPPEGRGEGRY